MHVVRRAFMCDGVERYAGEVLVGSQFANASALVDGEYMEPFTGLHIPCTICNRKFATKEYFDAHLADFHPTPVKAEAKAKAKSTK